jgi:hypothetical protein
MFARVRNKHLYFIKIIIQKYANMMANKTDSRKESIVLVEDFFDTPKIKKKISLKELKELYEQQYIRNFFKT